jgi:hypothetical protein
MKKQVLSLVAFMAFSVSAFANTIEVKEEVVVVDCFAVADKMTNAICEDAGGCTDEQSYNIFSGIYDSCVKNGNCDNCLNEVVVTG